MKITTTETIAGRMVEETLGVVRASVLWSRRVMKFNHGGLRGLSYTTMDEMAEGLQDARVGAEAKIITQAKAMGADSIISLRLEIIELSDGLFQANAIGTAVKTSSLPQAMPAFGNVANDDDDAFNTIPVFQKPTIRLVSNLMH